MILKVLAVSYFIFGYLTSLMMINTDENYLQSAGAFLLIYLTFQIVEQLRP
jgi:hypothetical protein